MSGVPRSEPPQPQRGSTLAVAFALLALLTGGFLFLILPLGFIGVAIFMVLLVFSGVACFHYFVWGRWLRRLLEDEQEEKPDA